MSAFGPGLLAGLGWDLGDEERVEVVGQAVRQAGVPRLREPVGGRVLEASREGGEVAVRWLPAEAAASVAGALRSGGSARGRDLEAVFGGDAEVLLPGLAGWKELRLAAAGHDERRVTARGLEEQRDRTRALLADLEAELPCERPSRLADARQATEALRSALGCIERCLEHGLALSASW